MWIAYAVLGLVVLVGFRLIALGVRLRSAPELALGVALAALKPGAVLLDHGMRAQLPGLITIGLACATTGTAAVGCFAQLTFRRREAWAQVLLALLVACLLYAHTLALTQLQTTGTPSILYLSSRMVLLGWAATEALLHRAAYAKRAVMAWPSRSSPTASCCSRPGSPRWRSTRRCSCRSSGSISASRCFTGRTR